MAARQSSRGRRATGGLVEECILVDQQMLNEIIIPTMNVNRRLPDGSRQEAEVVNKSQIFVTTAGWKNSFAYDKLIQILIQSIIEPDEAIILGGTWRIPVMEKLLQRSFIEDLKMDGGPKSQCHINLFPFVMGVYIYQTNVIYANGEA